MAVMQIDGFPNQTGYELTVNSFLNDAAISTVCNDVANRICEVQSKWKEIDFGSALKSM